MLLKLSGFFINPLGIGWGCLPEVVVVDGGGIDAEGVEHLVDRLAHHAGTAHVVLAVLGCLVVGQIGVAHHGSYKACGVFHASAPNANWILTGKVLNGNPPFDSLKVWIETLK